MCTKHQCIVHYSTVPLVRGIGGQSIGGGDGGSVGDVLIEVVVTGSGCVRGVEVKCWCHLVAKVLVLVLVMVVIIHSFWIFL